jgi:hypothetical protein
MTEQEATSLAGQIATNLPNADLNSGLEETAEACHNSPTSDEITHLSAIYDAFNQRFEAGYGEGI